MFGYATVSLDYLVNFRNGKGHEKNIVADGKYIVVNSKFISTDGQVKKYANEQICPLYENDILMVMSDLPNGRALAKCCCLLYSLKSSFAVFIAGLLSDSGTNVGLPGGL